MKRLRDREVEDTDGPLMIAPKLVDHSFVATRKSYRLIRGRAVPCCRRGLCASFCEAILKIELLYALIDRELGQEGSVVKMRNSGLRIVHICSKVIRSKLFVDFGLKSLHLFDNYSMLLSAHLFDLRALYLVLGHVCYLEHHARILQVRANGIHLLHYLVNALALQQFFLHQMEYRH